MTTIVELTAELAALLAALGLCFVLLLAHRRPLRPAWLRGEAASALLTIGALSLLILALGLLIKGLLGLGLDPLGAMTLGAAMLGLFAWGLWRGLRMKARLAPGAGRSPLAPGKSDEGT